MDRDFPLNLDVLKAVLDHLNVGVYITDRKRRILLWNRKAEEITGYRAEDVVGNRCHDEVLNHTDARGRPLCTTELCPLHRAMMADEESHRPVVVYVRHTEGKRLALEVNVGPLRDDEGRVVGGIETFQDVTRRMHDMERAREIQRQLMPRHMPDLPGVHLRAFYRPHEMVGGDLYDVMPLPNDRAGLLLADMRGHGVSAALSTTWLSSIADDIKELADRPQDYLRAMNTHVTTAGDDGTFATACYALLDAPSGRLTYAIAGHPPPLHYSAAAGAISELDGHGMPFGIDPDQPYGQDTVVLEPGDAVLLYTDGISETFDSDGRPLGTRGLKEVYREALADPPVTEGIYSRVLRRTGRRDLEDDVTLLLIQRRA